MSEQVVTIYQGEPINATIVDVDEHGTYVDDLSDYHFEAVLRDKYNRVVKSWPEADITYTQVVVEEETRGMALFGMSGTETAELFPQPYTLEVARVFSDGRAIAVLSNIIDVKPAVIKGGA